MGSDGESGVDAQSDAQGWGGDGIVERKARDGNCEAQAGPNDRGEGTGRRKTRKVCVLGYVVANDKCGSVGWRE